MDVAD